MLGKAVVGSVLALFAAIISFSALKWFSIPYLWIFLTWSSVFLCAIWLVPPGRLVWVGLAVVVLTLAGLEGYSWLSQHWIFKDIRSEGTFTWVNDDVLGYIAARGVAQTEKKFYRGEMVYDVVYTMDTNGLRISSAQPRVRTTSRQCVLFFGDAYTFGWGLKDQETMPYRVAVRSGEKYRVYNLAFLTHGAQQMLAELEHGLVGKETDCAPRDVRYVIYTATPDQIRRAAGLRTIDHRHGPRYVLGADGRVSYQGQFGEDRSRAEKIRSLLAQSYLYRKLVGGDAIYTRGYRDADVELYLSIVNAASSRVKNLYPDAQFHVLVWGNDALGLDRAGVLSRKLLGGLKGQGRGFVVHRINDILPGADEGKPEYFIGWKESLHPNATADDRIADYIVRNILKR